MAKHVSPANQFGRIAREMILRAEQVDCTLNQLAEGLRDMEIIVRDRRREAESELYRQEMNE